MANILLNKKRHQFTQVIGTKTGSISMITSQGFQSKIYLRRFGKASDLFARLSYQLLAQRTKEN
ncbi:hypothetical protein [Weissella soli]|uniref:hypothetical protein n=1 Tax=Weissella soli TaxID=155866 RepID=UPI0011BBC96D|nr:hypothetical protein [Weissella soli]QEA34795.1 hypothetical protein FGL88_03080 [Weissella soli]